MAGGILARFQKPQLSHHLNPGKTQCESSSQRKRAVRLEQKPEKQARGRSFKKSILKNTKSYGESGKTKMVKSKKITGKKKKDWKEVCQKAHSSFLEVGGGGHIWVILLLLPVAL